ncbi:MAG: hypothetical protein GY778_26910, partial [bacterium]|nr:hypothetical protein [bacterium]
MRRTILAILAGAVTSGAAAVACGPLDVYDHTQETVEWMMQRAWPDPAFVGVLHMTIGLLIGWPGVVVAVWIARRRPYPRGHC